MPKESESPLAKSLNDKLQRLFVVLILACVVLGGFRPVMDNVDLGWHIAQGRWMLEHLALYQGDHFNYPNLNHPLINEYPLFQIVLYLVWSLGWWGPCLLTAAICALLTGVLLQAGRNSSLAAFSIGLMLLFLQTAAPLRPHLVTYLSITVLGVFLLRHRETVNWTDFWPMALLQVAWTNSHSAFVLGPAMVGLFGTEMIVRKFISLRAFPWKTIGTWLAAFLFILAACFVNPWGYERFYPPFYQDQLESIRAYVGEMQPLDGGLATLCIDLTLLAFMVILLGMLRRRCAISCSFLFFALLFYFQALEVKKAWPIFGLFIPLLVLSGGAFAPPAPSSTRPTSWFSVFGHFLVTALSAIVFLLLIAGPSFINVPLKWLEFCRGRTELPSEATAWMNDHHIMGRLFQRSEIGGWLQQEGYDNGETFSDTGFGKYDEAFIHENGLIQERPALLPRYLAAYQPDFVVCNTFCFQWPAYLRQNGWRLIFYSPNSTVWTHPGLMPNLPTVDAPQIIAAFDRDIAANGIPSDIRLYGRNIISLQSLGLEDYAIAKLQSLPPELHHAPWYWEAARFICFAEPAASIEHRTQLLREAEDLHDDPVTAEFRALCSNSSGDGALHILEAIPPDQLDNGTAELLLKIYLDRKNPKALALAQRTDCWNLRNGHHWQYLAEAEDQAGHTDAASAAWKKAIFYYPDDTALIQGATAFAQKHNDTALAQAVADSAPIYGQK